jgi:NAD(P)-dependent dehydrogenase (short-subunit alcohol dehydrogenase family)
MSQSDPAEAGFPAAAGLAGTTALVTGASRGFGRAIAAALCSAGAAVIGVARDRTALDQVRAELGEAFTSVAADVTDPTVAGHLIDEYAPRILVLNAGAAPLNRPLQHHTWQTFSRNWEVDVAQAFHWTREALLRPLDPGSVVIAMSSGAAVMGSPTSGGYAGANATVRFISAYAAEESERAGLGIRFVAVLPKLTPTGVGAAGVTAYAARYAEGDVAAYLDSLGPTLTPEQVGLAIAGLAADGDADQPAYMLSPAGLIPAQ